MPKLRTPDDSFECRRRVEHRCVLTVIHAQRYIFITHEHVYSMAERTYNNMSKQSLLLVVKVHLFVVYNVIGKKQLNLLDNSVEEQ